MTEHEIFEKLKEALDYNYMYDSLEWDEERKEVDNLEDYLRIIKQEREIEKDFNDAELNRLNTYKEFIHYLHDKAIGNIDSIIECFENNSVNIFIGYKPVTKMLIDDKLYLKFEVNDTKYKAEWQSIDNYAVWQICGSYGDDYSGYLLFPTYKDNEYFVLWYQCLYKYHPKTRDELLNLIAERIKDEGNEVDLNDIDVSGITDMSWLLLGSDKFNGNISGWNVSNVTNMRGMFAGCENFNRDISKWDVSNVTDMTFMFDGCERFNQDISKWNVSKVTDMSFMFDSCKEFNQDIYGWNVSKVTDMRFMFYKCPIKNEYKPKF